MSRDELIDHILRMKQLDTDYARWALAQYSQQLPWMDLNQGVKQALSLVAPSSVAMENAAIRGGR